MFQLWIIGATIMLLCFLLMSIIYHITGVCQIKGLPHLSMWLLWLGVAPLIVAYVFIKQAIWFVS